MVQFAGLPFGRRLKGGMDIEDPFLVRNSGHLAAFFENIEVRRVPVPTLGLLSNVFKCGVRNGRIGLRNETGISLEHFKELLAFYLNSLFVTWNDNVHTQREGMCIGSCVALVLWDVFLSHVDRSVLFLQDESPILRVFRYVNNFLLSFMKL